MKKNVLTLLLAVVSFNIMDAAILSKSRISFVLFKNWDKKTKSVSPIPIDAFVEKNSYIEVVFLDDESQSGTFQIKDNYGNIIYYDTVMSDTNILHKIDISDLKDGQYELIYSDNYVEVGGKFTLYK